MCVILNKYVQIYGKHKYATDIWKTWVRDPGCGGPSWPAHTHPPGYSPKRPRVQPPGPTGPSGQGRGSARGQRGWGSGRSWTRSRPEPPASLPRAAGSGVTGRGVARAWPGRERRGPRVAGNLDVARAAEDLGGAWAGRGGARGHVTGRGYKAARSGRLRELVLSCDPAPGHRPEEPRLRPPAALRAPPRLRVSAAVLRPSPPARPAP